MTGTRPPRKAPLSEQEICQQIISYCDLKHIPIFRNNVGTATFKNPGGPRRYVAFGMPGMADYTLILFLKEIPILVYLEVKTEKGEQSPKQREFQHWCIERKIPYILARSVEDLEREIQWYLTHYGRYFHLAQILRE